MMSWRWGILVIILTLAVLAVWGTLAALSPPALVDDAVSTTPTPELIDKGRYLAAAGNCASCHTGPEGVPYAGGHAFHTPFGTIYSTNITSDEETGIGLWTEAQFKRAMHEGVDADGRHLYPVLPYQSYTKVSDEDVSAIFAYLRTLQRESYVPPENEMKFPFGWRALMGAWKAMYLETGRFEPDPLQSADWNRGAYLVEGLSHCGACHTPRNALGSEKRLEAFSGATYLDEVEQGMTRLWAAVNLTSAPAGLGPWSVEDLAKYLKTGHSQRAGTFGPMNKVIVNSTSRLTDEDIGAMAVYLKSLPAMDRNEPQKLSSDERQEGEHVYSIHCATCHLPTGLLNDKGPPVADSAVVLAPDPATLINVILYGAVVPEPEPEGAWESMEGFELKLDDEEVAALANYMRTSWGHAAGKVTIKQVEAQR